jgi:hypothetical protein
MLFQYLLFNHQNWGLVPDPDPSTVWILIQGIWIIVDSDPK